MANSTEPFSQILAKAEKEIRHRLDNDPYYRSIRVRLESLVEDLQFLMQSPGIDNPSDEAVQQEEHMAEVMNTSEGTCNAQWREGSPWDIRWNNNILDGPGNVPCTDPAVCVVKLYGYSHHACDEHRSSLEYWASKQR
jgi:hypothetical protein